MKNNILIIGCIISCLILVSLTYQPIMAEDNYIESDPRNVDIYFFFATLNEPFNINETDMSIEFKFIFWINYRNYDFKYLALDFNLNLVDGSIHMGFGSPRKFVGINNDNLLCGFLIK